MSPKERELRDKLVRNFNSAEMSRDERAPSTPTPASTWRAQGTLDGAPHAFGRMHREKDDLDYWDGEP